MRVTALCSLQTSKTEAARVNTDKDREREHTRKTFVTRRPKLILRFCLLCSRDCLSSNSDDLSVRQKLSACTNRPMSAYNPQPKGGVWKHGRGGQSCGFWC